MNVKRRFLPVSAAQVAYTPPCAVTNTVCWLRLAVSARWMFLCVLCAEMEKIESPDYALSPPGWQIVIVPRLSSHKTNVQQTINPNNMGLYMAVELFFFPVY